MSVIAKLEITIDDKGNCNVEGTGALLQQKAYAYGLLELAKEVIREGARQVQPAGAEDLARFTRQ